MQCCRKQKKEDARSSAFPDFPKAGASPDFPKAGCLLCSYSFKTLPTLTQLWLPEPLGAGLEP